MSENYYYSTMADQIRGSVYNFVPEHDVAWRNHRKTMFGRAYFWTQVDHIGEQPHHWLRFEVTAPLRDRSGATVKLIEVDPDYKRPMNKTLVGAATDYVQRVISAEQWTRFPFTGHIAVVEHTDPTSFSF